MADVDKQSGAHVSYTKLKRHYELLLNGCNQLVEPDTEEEVEQSVVRITCVKAFLLLLLGYTHFADILVLL